MVLTVLLHTDLQSETNRVSFFKVWLSYWEPLLVKGVVQPEVKILPLFIHPQVATNPYVTKGTLNKSY